MKYVESWFVELMPNGIYSLTINTTERWINFHAYNDTTFAIGDKEDNTVEESLACQLEIPEFLPKIEKGLYLQTVQQEKDQISFYWIPWYFKWSGERNIILESPKK